MEYHVAINWLIQILANIKQLKHLFWSNSVSFVYENCNTLSIAKNFAQFLIFPFIFPLTQICKTFNSVFVRRLRADFGIGALPLLSLKSHWELGRNFNDKIFFFSDSRKIVNPTKRAFRQFSHLPLGWWTQPSHQVTLGMF